MLSDRSLQWLSSKSGRVFRKHSICQRPFLSAKGAETEIRTVYRAHTLRVKRKESRKKTRPVFWLEKRRFYDLLTIVCQAKLVQTSWTIQPGQSLTSRPEQDFVHREVTNYIEPKVWQIIDHIGFFLLSTESPPPEDMRADEKMDTR